MFLELKEYPKDLLFFKETTESHKLKEMASRVRVKLSTRQTLKREVWENARRKGWLT
jgi:hypothetical protein